MTLLCLKIVMFLLLPKRGYAMVKILLKMNYCTPAMIFDMLKWEGEVVVWGTYGRSLIDSDHTCLPHIPPSGTE